MYRQLNIVHIVKLEKLLSSTTNWQNKNTVFLQIFVLVDGRESWLIYENILYICYSFHYTFTTLRIISRKINILLFIVNSIWKHPFCFVYIYNFHHYNDKNSLYPLTKQFQSFKEAYVSQEDGQTMLQEIARNIRKMMTEKVDAVKVGTYLL